jgi:hypothetical protein
MCLGGLELFYPSKIHAKRCFCYAYAAFWTRLARYAAVLQALSQYFESERDCRALELSRKDKPQCAQHPSVGAAIGITEAVRGKPSFFPDAMWSRTSCGPVGKSAAENCISVSPLKFIFRTNRHHRISGTRMPFLERSIVPFRSVPGTFHGTRRNSCSVPPPALGVERGTVGMFRARRQVLAASFPTCLPLYL